MYDQTMSHETQPWYRQFWPWLLISLPASAVIGGIITIIIAVQSPNALVVDDYYKEGLAINQHKGRLANAKAMELEGLARSDETRITLDLSSATPVTDDSLTLYIAHSTRAELDRVLTLQRTIDGNYSADFKTLLPGNWYLRLQPADLSWEIRARIVIDGPFQARLTSTE